VWTIGYGSTSGVTRNTPPITQTAALARLKSEVQARYGAAVNSLNLPFNQNQFDALTSFVYNVGPGGVAASTSVGRNLRAHNWQAAADSLLAWNKAGGQVLQGLVRRRQAERELFLRPYAGAPAPAPAEEEDVTPEQDRIIRDILSNVAGTGPMNQHQNGMLAEIQRAAREIEKNVAGTGEMNRVIVGLLTEIRDQTRPK